MEKPIFRVDGISKSFGDHLILDDVSFDIYPGEIFSIIGASGTGKTTFLNTLIGFLRPDSGDITFRLKHLLATEDSEIYRSVFSKQQTVKQVYGFASQLPCCRSSLLSIVAACGFTAL